LGFNQLISAARQFSTGTNSVGVQSHAYRQAGEGEAPHNSKAVCGVNSRGRVLGEFLPRTASEAR